MSIFIALAATLGVFAYLADIPGMALLSALFLHLFFIGFIARAWLGNRRNVVIESLLLSVGITAASGLVLGNAFPVADVWSRATILGLTVLGAWLKRRHLSNAWQRLGKEWRIEGRWILIILAAAALPFFVIFLTNPTYGLISDGWWHCSIYNTIQLGGLPPANPWYASEPLGYPYAYHVYLAYAARQLDCFQALNSFNYVVTAIGMLAIYAIAKETFGNKKTATLASVAFLFVSHLGGAVFLYDLIQMLPSTGLEGYLEFLQSVHGPHVYYGHLAFMGSALIIPFQMATMMAGFHFALLGAVLYFLHQRKELVVGVLLGTLVATNPVAGILGVLTTGIFFLLTYSHQRLKNWIGAAVVGIIIASNYIGALLDKMNVVGGTLVVGDASPHLLAGFIAGYLPLLILTAVFFVRYQKVSTRKIWIGFAIALVIAGLGIGKLPVYIYTDSAFLFAIAMAPWLVGLWEWKKNWWMVVLVAILAIPTFLVVGSYSYYKMPLDEEELEAAGWMEENTDPSSIFLVSMDLEQRFNIHQYVPVFAKRRLYLGDPGLMRTYGEDITESLDIYQRIMEEKNPAAICNAKENGIDYIYFNDGGVLNTSCTEEVYQHGQVRIYATG